MHCWKMPSGCFAGKFLTMQHFYPVNVSLLWSTLCFLQEKKIPFMHTTGLKIKMQRPDKKYDTFPNNSVGRARLLRACKWHSIRTLWAKSEPVQSFNWGHLEGCKMTTRRSCNITRQQSELFPTVCVFSGALLAHTYKPFIHPVWGGYNGLSLSKCTTAAPFWLGLHI